MIIASLFIHRSKLICVPRFNLFLPLHSLWLGYMSELLALSPPTAPSSFTTAPSAANMHAKLVKADFHGAIITGMDHTLSPGKFAQYIRWFMSSVKQSKNPCLVGLRGIVVHETENAFKIITRNDALKCASPYQMSLKAVLICTFQWYRSKAPSSLLRYHYTHCSAMMHCLRLRLLAIILWRALRHRAMSSPS